VIKVIVDLNLCQSYGECVHVVPDLFRLADDDILEWKDEVDEARRADLEQAVDVCPMMAIRLKD
jgi:ferredoxin